MKCFLVSHTHWDREWYRTFQQFRARLVDTIDRVLDLVAADPGFHFVLDGQTVVLEDYLEIRPDRRSELERACRSGRLAIGPWYVQPDSLLPSGEAHIRNLLEGRRGGAIAPLSSVAYCPDSFGHPAQFPQLFSGFGLDPFIYWRGNGDEIDRLPAEYAWEAPDGSAILAHHLGEGYFAACSLPADADAAAAWLAELAARLAERTRDDRVLLMNGFDHARPQAHTGAVAEALARVTGWAVHRGLLDDFARGLSRNAPRFRGELTGGRVANLLPGVWSARLPLKLRNRRAESLLEGWAEPWSALGAMLGAPDERPALRLAWRALLQNQAHDSICGCSQDRVHEQMISRYDAAEELARETTARALERLAGLGPERRTPWTEEIDVAVFNPSAHPRTDVVCFDLDPDMWIEFRGETARGMEIHPWLRAGLTARGFTVGGHPARLLIDDSARRVRLTPEMPPVSVEFVAADVPAFGWRRFRLAPSPTEHADREDDGDEIRRDGLCVRAAPDGTLAVQIGDHAYAGLCAIEDRGDRGDTYDFDPVPGGTVTTEHVRVTRRIHPSGVQDLEVRRTVRVPAALRPDRTRRDRAAARVAVRIDARLAPGVRRVDLQVRVTNTAKDHRLRLLFPTGQPVRHCESATTFDVARRDVARRDATNWVHPAPTTFAQQGFVSAGGLTVAAPGLYEAEVTADGIIAITLIRAVGWLARMDLRSRPQPAGPAIPTPGAQCLETIVAHLAVLGEMDPRAVRDAELGLRAVAAGPEPLLQPNGAVLEVMPPDVVITALKPAEVGPGLVLRVLNPTDTPHEARIRTTLPLTSALPVRLDETPCGDPLAIIAGAFTLAVPPHALRSVLLTRDK